MFRDFRQLHPNQGTLHLRDRRLFSISQAQACRPHMEAWRPGPRRCLGGLGAWRAVAVVAGGLWLTPDLYHIDVATSGEALYLPTESGGEAVI